MFAGEGHYGLTLTKFVVDLSVTEQVHITLKAPTNWLQLKQQQETNQRG